MGMSISSSRASAAMVSQPISPQPPAPKLANIESLLQAVPKPLKLATEGNIGSLINTMA
jgi:hypothetical protein